MMLRIFSIAIMLGLAACASAPGESDISARIASWQGAHIDELITALGPPSGMTPQGTWVWQFAGPERRQVGGGHPYSTLNTDDETLSVVQACADCLPGQGMTHSGGAETGNIQTTCTYLGYIEDETVVKLTTLSKPGTHCAFDELTPRLNE